MDRRGRAGLGGAVTTKPMLLASASPRRSELLRALGIPFEIAVAAVTEITPATAPELTASALAEANAVLKARAVPGAGRWVLGADTVVSRAGRIFGKPATMEEAREFLRALGGGMHEVATGCALLGPDGTEEIFHEITRVVFYPLSEETISRYHARVGVLDKAGGYALQEEAEMLVARVEGSRSNVIGLPIERLGELLRRRGLLTA